MVSGLKVITVRVSGVRIPEYSRSKCKCPNQTLATFSMLTVDIYVYKLMYLRVCQKCRIIQKVKVEQHL